MAISLSSFRVPYGSLPRFSILLTRTCRTKRKLGLRRGYNPPQVDTINMAGVYHNKIPIYPIFYLLKGDYMRG